MYSILLYFVVIFLKTEGRPSDVDFAVSAWRQMSESSLSMKCGPRQIDPAHISSAITVSLMDKRSRGYHPWFVIMWHNNVVRRDILSFDWMTPAINAFYDKSTQSLSIHVRVPKRYQAKMLCVIERRNKSVLTKEQYAWFPLVNRILFLPIEAGGITGSDEDLFKPRRRVRIVCEVELGSPLVTDKAQISGVGGGPVTMGSPVRRNQFTYRNATRDFTTKLRHDDTEVVCSMAGAESRRRIYIERAPKIRGFPTSNSTSVSPGDVIRCKSRGRPVPHVSIQGHNATHMAWREIGQKGGPMRYARVEGYRWEKGETSVVVPKGLQTGVYQLRCVAKSFLGSAEQKNEFRVTVKPGLVVAGSGLQWRHIIILIVCGAILFLLLLVCLICLCFWLCCRRRRRKKLYKKRPSMQLSNPYPPPPPALLASPKLPPPPAPTRPPPPPPGTLERRPSREASVTANKPSPEKVVFIDRPSPELPELPDRTPPRNRLLFRDEKIKPEPLVLNVPRQTEPRILLLKKDEPDRPARNEEIIVATPPTLADKIMEPRRSMTNQERILEPRRSISNKERLLEPRRQPPAEARNLSPQRSFGGKDKILEPRRQPSADARNLSPQRSFGEREKVLEPRRQPSSDAWNLAPRSFGEKEKVLEPRRQMNKGEAPTKSLERPRPADRKEDSPRNTRSLERPSPERRPRPPQMPMPAPLPPEVKSSPERGYASVSRLPGPTPTPANLPGAAKQAPRRYNPLPREPVPTIPEARDEADAEERERLRGLEKRLNAVRSLKERVPP